MNARMWGIIGGVALVLALLSPLVLGNSKKVAELFEAANLLYERSDYKGAITKYSEALKESKKLGVKTGVIDKDFTTLANLKIAWCYYERGEETGDPRHYQSALTHIKKVVLEAKVAKHREELAYLCAENLYKIGDVEQAESKFSSLIKRFPNSKWVPKAELRIAELTPPTDNDKNSSDRPIPDPEPIGKTMYEQASELKRQEKLHDAYQLYTDLIEQHPESEYVANAYVGRAEIHLDAKDYVNARANYEEAMYSTADKERRRELYEAYHGTYLVPEPPNPKRKLESSDKLFVNARLLRKEGRFLAAAKIYQKLANNSRSTEDTVYALYWAARCYQEAGRASAKLFGEAVDIFRRLIRDYSDSPEIIKSYYYLAAVFMDWAEQSDDKAQYQSVIDTVADADARYGDGDDPGYRGWLSRMQELKEIARQKLDPIPKPRLDPTPGPEPPDPLEPPAPKPLPEVVLINKGYTYLGRSELKEATEYARRALEINPNYQRAHGLLSEIKELHYERGWTFFGEEQYDKAIAEFRSAIDIDRDFKDAYCHLGVVYIEQQKYTEAIKVLQKAVGIDAAFKEAHFNLALAYLKLGEFENARHAATAALRIDPNYEPARVLIEFIAD